MTRLEEMKKLATGEAVKLKEHATEEERSRLLLDQLNPENFNRCIYGQMTGDCNSPRAMDLIRLCATRVYNTKRIGLGQNVPDDAKLNGAPYQKIERAFRVYEYQSPIELIIYEENGGMDAQKKLIAFLKDETQTLEL